jgi:hypothetical protein
MKCAACNVENPAAAKFCQACGVPLAMQRAPGQQTPGAEPKSAGLQISPTIIGIVLLLAISVVGAGYVGWTLYEDSSSPGGTALADEKAIEEKRKKAEQDRLADERQKTLDAEREKQRQMADAEQAMKLAQAKADEDRRRAEDAARGAQENAKRAEARAREDARAAQEAQGQQQAKAQQEARAQQEAKAREAKAKEDARAKELARQREERAAAAREARARQQATATSTARPVEVAAPAPTPAPVQPAPVAVAQAPAAAAPAQNDPCAGLTGLKREQCTSCNRHTFGPRKAACEDRAMERYCETRWNKPGEPGCVDPRRR